MREGAGLMDMSFMTKLRVTGADAGRVLDHVSAGAVDGEAERITYTQWLDPDGKLQADLTVTKLADDDFWVVASDTAHGHVLAWLARHIGGADVTIEDVTEDWAQLNVQGPRRATCSPPSPTPTCPPRPSPSAPRASSRSPGSACCSCGSRTSASSATSCTSRPPMRWPCTTRVAAAGATPVGLKTLASCRMEKGYRDFGHDIDNTDNVIEVGLGFAVDLDKPNFIGRDAVVRIKAAGVPHRRLVQVRLTDPGPVLHHAELVLRDGEVVGYVRAASYGWTLGGAVGLALLDAGEPLTADWIKAGTWTVDVAGTEHEAVVSLRPMYDPTNERIKA